MKKKVIDVQRCRPARISKCMRKLHADGMCVIGLELANGQIRLSASAKRFAQPHHPNCPSSDKPKIWLSASEATLGGCTKNERKCVPYLLELLDGTLVDTAALVDQVCMPM